MNLDRRGAVRGRSRLRRPAALVAVALLLLGGCGSSGPSAAPTTATLAPSPSAPAPSTSASASAPVDPQALYASIEDQVVAIRELTPKKPVDPKILDDAGIRKLVADSFAKDNPPATVAANERMLKALGLLPATASLSALEIALLGGQVAGLYNPDDKTLYVVSRSGAIGPAEKTTVAHEFTHALQDQNFDLGALKLDEIGQGDRSLGRLALVEGDAVLTQSLWQTQHLSGDELGELLKQAGNDPSTKLLLDAPPILRETLLFPYIQGAAFVQGLQGRGGWPAVDAAFSAPPASTEQILHPDKYASGEAPIAVSLPKDLATRLGSGWTVALEDSMGEFQLQVWLRGNTAIGAGGANDAAAGWGGDRVAVVDGPGGAWAVILRTAWDTAADATAFEAAATPLVGALANPGSVLPGAGGPERWVVIGSDAATLSRAGNAVGLAG